MKYFLVLFPVSHQVVKFCHFNRLNRQHKKEKKNANLLFFSDHMSGGVVVQKKSLREPIHQLILCLIMTLLSNLDSNKINFGEYLVERLFAQINVDIVYDITS